MKETQRAYYLNALGNAQDEFDTAVAEIGNKIRLEVIIPACKQHNLEFISGNGMFYFTTQSGKHYGEAGEVIGTRLERALKPIFDLLNKDVTHNDYLGYYVPEVRKKDYK